MDNDFVLGEMVMIEESEYDEMISDLDYWVTAAEMLSALLNEYGIDHEVSEETVNEYRVQSFEGGH